LNASRNHKGLRLSSENCDYWGEIARFSWDRFNFFQRAVFYDLPDCVDDAEVTRKLIASAQLNSMLFVEIRPVNNVPDRIESVFRSLGFIKENHLNATIPILEPDIMWEKLDRDKKKGIRRAKSRYGLEVVESSNPDDLVKFYRILAALYKTIRHPLKDLSYFRSLFDHLPKGGIRLLLCRDESNIIAGQIALCWLDRVIALYTATDPIHMHKHAGDLLIWYMLKNISYEEGYRVFDFGGGGNPDKPYKPREYKKRFGTKFDNIGRYIYSNRADYRLVNYIYQRRLKS
jgi:hypothetical protein